MKLGIMTAAFPTLALDEVAAWAHAEGFQTIEVACWPAAGSERRRYAGTAHIDVDALDAAAVSRVCDVLAANELTISALAYYPNNLDPDPAVRSAAHDHLRQVIVAAGKLGVPTVGTFIGRDQHRSVDDNLAEFERVWPDLVHFAADHGVNVAIENCPMIFSGDEWPGGKNIAYSPAIWRRMFEAIPDPNFGLNLDPSHLVWQFIDVERVVREFGARIMHVHAKDLEVDREGLYLHGVMSAGIGWQVPRLPGLGEVPWRRFVAALYRAGYDNVLSIEHEDRSFEGSVELVKRGFLIARDTLRPLVA
ncbi:MAG TPA: sugar phosphate isomerase/epimerase [Candidatus Limnocylindrales bacterium]